MAARVEKVPWRQTLQEHISVYENRIFICFFFSIFNANFTLSGWNCQLANLVCKYLLVLSSPSLSEKPDTATSCYLVGKLNIAAIRRRAVQLGSRRTWRAAFNQFSSSCLADCEPEEVSDWSFDDNCLFCCLRREKVKVGAPTWSPGGVTHGCKCISLSFLPLIRTLQRAKYKNILQVFLFFLIMLFKMKNKMKSTFFYSAVRVE